MPSCQNMFCWREPQLTHYHYTTIIIPASVVNRTVVIPRELRTTAVVIPREGKPNAVVIPNKGETYYFGVTKSGYTI